MRRGLVAFGLVVPLVLAGCGGGNSGESPSETSASQDSAGSAAAVQNLTLTCTGGDVTSAVLSNSASDPGKLIVAWGGHEAGNETVAYIVTVSSADGSVSRQAGFKWILSTDERAQYVYDLGSSKQTNIEPADASQSPSSFPDVLAGVSGAWKATAVVSVDGQDVVTCA